jgi:hypothetical protein
VLCCAVLCFVCLRPVSSMFPVDCSFVIVHNVSSVSGLFIRDCP